MSVQTIIVTLLLISLAGLTTYALVKKQDSDQRMVFIQSEMLNQEARHLAELESIRKKMAKLDARHQAETESVRKQIAVRNARHQQEMADEKFGRYTESLLTRRTMSDQNARLQYEMADQEPLHRQEIADLESRHRTEMESTLRKMADQESRHKQELADEKFGRYTESLLTRRTMSDQNARLQYEMANEESRHQQEMADQESRHKVATEKVSAEIASLEKYRHIPEILEKATKTKEEYEATLSQARKRALEIVQTATAQAEHVEQKARSDADDTRAKVAEDRRLAENEIAALFSTSKKQIENLLSQVRIDAKEKKLQAEDALNHATIYAAEIIQLAERKASEIGSKAYEALKKAEFYTSVAAAMRNAVDGYGDRYVKPTATILDEWAEEYGFHKSGERLRLARDRIRIMQKNHTAATCDYVEAHRRLLAINFVLDAFNGKIDSILTRIKSNNYGTLEQEVKDSFSIVNFNGSAFRGARVTEGFLEARLDELKWSLAVQALRQKDKDEQRIAKERIREEERSQREFERSIRQAQRDEEMLKKAMDKLRHDYDLASVEERTKYEAKLIDLSIKLKEAEERNQRALSMAQQTRCGHVYVISNIGSFGEDVFKIGLTRRLEPTDRVRELGDASVPFAFDIHTLMYSEDAPALETALHKRFVESQVNKVNRRKEFFRVGLSDIRKVIDEMRPDVKWTLAAEAKDYRETLAIERRIQEDPEFQKQWTEVQMKFTPSDAVDEEELVEDIFGKSDGEID